MGPATKKEIQSLLLESKDYREFLTKAFDSMKRNDKHFGFAKFSRQAGFSARSYPRDVILGRRQITSRSLLGFIHALALPAELGRYFTLLVALDNPDVCPPGVAPAEILEAMEKIKASLRKRQLRTELSSGGSIYRFGDWPLVFASLGDPAHGADLSEIGQRSALSRERCLSVLEEMVKGGIVRRDEGSQRYFAVSSHVVYPGLDDKSQFKTYFLKTLQRIEKSAKDAFGSSEKLFLSSSLTVSREKLPEFKAELRELLLRYIDKMENPQGDSVATFLVALSPNQPTLTA